MRAPELRIERDGRVSGFAGVNRLTAALDLDTLPAGGFSLEGPVATTRMAGPPEAMNLEGRFLDALEQATGFIIEGRRLALTRDEKTLLLFEGGS